MILAVLGGLAAHATPFPPPTGDTGLSPTGDTGLPPTGDTGLPGIESDTATDSGLDTSVPPIDTGDTGPPPIDTDTDTDDTDIPPSSVTDLPVDSFCEECLTSAELANEQGGGPCEEGCSSASAGAASMATLVTAALVLLRRPR